MTPAKIAAIYVTASAAIVAFARPGYDLISEITILLGGSLGSLKLAIDSAQDIRYETADSGRQFSAEALAVSIIALVIWLVGFWVAYMTARSRWKGGFLARLIGVWVVGSGYNILWFAIRSV